MLIKFSDAKELNYCSRGIRYWCKLNGIDFLKFVREGLDEKILLKSNDSMAIKVVKYVKNRKK